MNTRQILLVTLAILLMVGVGVWWYFGFSLDFMRFFAAEPGVTDTNGRLCPAPAGCTCQQVQCFTTPCDPVIVCPGKCVERPACLDAKPASCDIAEPAEGWCKPAPGGRIVSCSPNTQTVSVGESARLTAAGGSGEYNWFAPEGSLNNFGTTGGAAVPGTASVFYDTAGTKKVTVQSPRGDGSPNVDSVACTVVVTPITR